ncbi:hypothetical protein FHG66_18930 [Rubellimicrobium rubrum]|uniref:Uncharacterized protein n=1 Tax=Rubellimicrobium rubrum TaxID=2585369 RepID=A0A5C4ML64_9RHOB|nr:hypothetical protein [Rubellimicrobium rubrum]TNC46498.1 hypothetical protein FHG66_18930 [Rubellimicrobium rubrum]
MNEEDQAKEDRIRTRIDAITHRLQKIAAMEGDAVWVGGLAARGVFEAERDRLISENEELLERWESLYKPPQ